MLLQLLLFCFNHLLHDALALTGGRICSKSESYAAYRSEIRTRYYKTYRSECCSTFIGLCTNTCVKSDDHSENYYVSISYTAYRLSYMCCIGYTQNGDTCEPNASWSQWSQTACYNPFIIEKSRARLTRTCNVNTCFHAERQRYVDSCPNTYNTPNYVPGTERTQCPNSGCQTLGYFDADFSLDFKRFYWLKPKSLKIIVSAKKAANGDFDLTLDPTKFEKSFLSTTSINARSNIQGLSNVEINYESKHKDYIFNRIETEPADISFTTANLLTGNTLEFKVQSQVTGNDQPDSSTYLSAGFIVTGYPTADDGVDDEEEGEIITIIQNKRATSTSSSSTQLQFSENLSLRGIRQFVIPRVISFDHYIETIGKRVYDVYSRAMIPMAFAKAQDFHIHFQNTSDKISKDEMDVTLFTNKILGSFMSYRPYTDPTNPKYGLNARMECFDDNEIFTTTYLKLPVISAITDFTYCPEGGCSPSKPLTYTKLRAAGAVHTIQSSSKFIDGYARIKHRESGLCWKVGDNQNIVLSSQCKDTFLLHSSSELLHKGTGQRVKSRSYISDTKRTFYLDGSSGNKFAFVNGSTLAWVKDYNWQFCLIEDTGSPAIDESSEAPHKVFKCTKTKSIVTFLPDFSDHYNELNTKTILQVGTSSGQAIILICEPKADLKSKPNCRYTFDKGQQWKDIPPFITQIKFYSLDDDGYYGYCYRATQYCLWRAVDDRIFFVDDAVYNEKLAAITSTASLDLDGMELTTIPLETSEDPHIAVSSQGILKLVNGNWVLFYQWMN